VRVSAAMTNPLNNTGIDITNPEKNTQLKGFVFPNVGLLKIQHIGVGLLRTFCSQNGVGSQLVNGQSVRPSKLQKKTAADAIAAKFPEYELAAARGQGDAFSRNTNSGVEPHFNMKRFLNTMTSREFAPRLLEIGARLDRNALNEGLKTDENIFRFFLSQYNNQSKNNTSSFNHLRNFDQDASKFTPFSENDWPKAKKEVQQC
jgi:hypothetical protein